MYKPGSSLGDVLSRLATDRQDNWRRYTARTGLDGQVPATLADVIADVTAFVDPVLDTSVDIDAFLGSGYAQVVDVTAAESSLQVTVR